MSGAPAGRVLTNPAEDMARLHNAAVAANQLMIWAVYRNPADAPGRCVLRPFLGATPLMACVVADTVEELAGHCRRLGLTRLPRSPGDEPQIVETWL